MNDNFTRFSDASNFFSHLERQTQPRHITHQQSITAPPKIYAQSD